MGTSKKGLFQKAAAVTVATALMMFVGRIPDASAAFLMFVDRGYGHASHFTRNVWYADSATRLSYGVRMGGHSGLYENVNCYVDYRNAISSGACDYVNWVEARSTSTYSYKVRCMSPSIASELSTHVHCWSYYQP